MNYIYQQGDVILKKRDRLPVDIKLVNWDKEKAWVLAHGEVTGHKHAIYEMDMADLYEDENGTLWIKVKDICDLKHEEHHTQTLTPGIYEIGIVKEVDPFTDEIRNVID